MPKEKRPNLKVNAGDMVAGWRNRKMIFGYVTKADILQPQESDNPHFEVEWFPDNDDLSGTYGLGVVVEIQVALGTPIMYSIQYPDDVVKAAPWATQMIIEKNS